MDSQIPVSGIFNANSLKWVQSIDKRSKYKIVRKAAMPWSRVNDFVQGEAAINEFETSFKKYCHHHRDISMLKVVESDSWMEEIV